MHHSNYNLFNIVSAFLSFNTTPIIILVNAHTVQSIYFLPVSFKSNVTIELKSVAQGVAIDGLDRDLEFF